MKTSKNLVLSLVGGSIVFGIVLIMVSLLATNKGRDRETALAAAKYDGTALLDLLKGGPAVPAGMAGMEVGPITPDLSHADEAWIVWEQEFSSESGLPAAITWYRERLPQDEWSLSHETPGRATFQKEEWTIVLETNPQANPPRIRREVKWTRDPDTL